MQNGHLISIKWHFWQILQYFWKLFALYAQFWGLAESLTKVFPNMLFNVFHDILSKIYNEYIFPVLRRLK